MTPSPLRPDPRSRLARALGRGAALALLAAAGLLPPPAHAQDLPAPGDGFAWERVGDSGINAGGFAFAPDATLYAAGVDGPFRLDASAGPPGAWVLLDDYPFVGALLVLGRAEGDTLLAGLASTKRSVDGGRSWEIVYGEGGGGLLELPAWHAHAGRVLTGDDDLGVGYSDDRGATWAEADLSYWPSAGAHDFAVLPPGSQYPGRVLAPGGWGVLRYRGLGVALAEPAAEAGGAGAGGRDAGARVPDGGPALPLVAVVGGGASRRSRTRRCGRATTAGSRGGPGPAARPGSRSTRPRPATGTPSGCSRSGPPPGTGLPRWWCGRTRGEGQRRRRSRWRRRGRRR
ncbi:MAG: hypothetical protein R3181_00840 [Rubricoccaceae bacterium]|nr:hypothetical protein [Rubricoccaceae bacterium]